MKKYLIMMVCVFVTFMAKADYDEVVDFDNSTQYTGHRFDNTDQQLEREQVRIMREQLLQEQRRNIQEQQYLINQQFQQPTYPVLGQ